MNQIVKLIKLPLADTTGVRYSIPRHCSVCSEVMFCSPKCALFYWVFCSWYVSHLVGIIVSSKLYALSTDLSISISVIWWITLFKLLVFHVEVRYLSRSKQSSSSRCFLCYFYFNDSGLRRSSTFPSLGGGGGCTCCQIFFDHLTLSSHMRVRKKAAWFLLCLSILFIFILMLSFLTYCTR